MSNMQTQHCPVPAQSQCTQRRSYYRALEELFGTRICGLHILAYVYVIILMRNTHYNVHSICEHTTLEHILVTHSVCIPEPHHKEEAKRIGRFAKSGVPLFRLCINVFVSLLR